MISLRQAFENRYIELDMSKGLHHLNDFYKDVEDKHGISVFPYNSIRTLIKSLEWPASWTPLPYGLDYPDDREPGWSEELQGVTHDDQYWYFAQKSRLWRFPVTFDLNSSCGLPMGLLFEAEDAAVLGEGIGIVGGIRVALMPKELEDEGFVHLGALYFHKGILYVPVEGHGQIIAIFNTDLKFLGSAGLVQSGAPWCAVNPQNGLLFSSSDRINKDNPLCVYKPILIANNQVGVIGVEELQYLGNFPLYNEKGGDIEICRIQGGCFSPRGHLYLVSDMKMEYGGGIKGFDMTTGRLSASFGIGYNGVESCDESLGISHSEELEGMTIWNLPGNGSAPNLSGQIHVIMIDNFGDGDDDLFFKHFWVVNPEDIDKI
jgi:hypothetical protein